MLRASVQSFLSVDFPFLGIYLISVSLPGICNRLEVGVLVKTVLIRAEDVATDRCSRYGRSCAHYYVKLSFPSWESDLPFARICNSSQVVGFVSGT